MIEYIVYGIGFFIITIVLQYILSRTCIFSKKGIKIWRGKECIIGMCMLGILLNKMTFFAAILGFVLGDNVAISMGWHEKD